MESLGQILRETRESRGISLVQAEKETFILKSYLEALEQENFSAFPAETYLLGFLRSYSEYLGLDASRMISLYKNMMKQEQEVPVEELVGKHRSVPVAAIVFVSLVLVVGGFFAWFLISNQSAPVAESSAEQPEVSLVDFPGGALERAFTVNSGVRIELDNNTYSVVFKDFFDDHAVITYGDEKSANVFIGKDVKLDLTGDGNPDIKIIAREYLDEASGRSIAARFDRSVNDVVSAAVPVGLEAEENELVVESNNSLISPIGSTIEGSRKFASYVVLSSADKDVMLLDLGFRGPCVARIKIDNAEPVERFFKKGEVFRESVKNSAWIWLSNAGVVSARISNKELSLGEEGEPAVWMLTWVRNRETGQYQLDMVPAY